MSYQCCSLTTLIVFILLLIVLTAALSFSSNYYNTIEQSRSNDHPKPNKTAVNDTSKTEQVLKADRLSIIPFKKFETRRLIRCGKRKQSKTGYDSRIVGGKIASVYDYPWIISLQRERSFWFGFKGFYHSCGGTLITPSWIVTASHCLYNRDEFARAVAGTDNMNYLYRAQLRSIEKSIMHERFDINTYENDIALLKVNRPFVLDSTFSPVGTICLERDIPVLPYDIAQICGFGAKEFKQATRSHLYSTDIAIIDQRTCNSSFDDAITSNMICAGGMVAKKRDACSGDSGGPLMLENMNHVSLIGVVSFGHDCAYENYPGIYTRVDNYIDWIMDKIDEPLIDP